MEAFITINCSNYSDNIIDIINLFQEIGWEIYNSKGEIEFYLLEMMINMIGRGKKCQWKIFMKLFQKSLLKMSK